MNKRVPLMCTVNNAFGPSDMLPPDGMCDAIFYDSLYRDGRNALTGTYDAGLEHFLELGQGMQFTGIGVSFDVQNIILNPTQDLTTWNVGKFDVRSPDVASGLLKLWNRGVTHFGALRVYGNGTGEEEVIAFLSFLQVVESTIQERMSTSRHYTVLGVSYNREASYENVIRHMKIGLAGNFTAGSIFKKESFVACEQQLLFTEAVDFLEATCLLLLSYYIFNLAYTDPVTTTLEFLLREMFNVNPERDSKLSNGRKSRTTMDNRIMKLVQWTTR
ncbi:hypothetical protein MRX96_014669 [Rhipicephalus microplus]